jgi:glycosyltransferase involved in cell wall biosynthesis
MTSSKENKRLRVVMILGSMPPMPMGGAEIQAVRLCKELNKMNVETEIITYGKIWNARRGEFDGVPFRRLSSILDLFTDVLSLLKPKPQKQTIKIVYDDSKEKTAEITSKVWIGMVSRYTLFYWNALVYLWFKRNRFDIIHAHMMEWPAIVSVRLGKKLNKAVVIKDSTMNGLYSITRYPDGREKQQQIIGYAHCVAMTKMIHKNLSLAGVPDRRITDIPNGIEISIPPVRTRKWNNKVIFVGNLTQQPAKGIDILLFAWKKVVTEFPDASLEIAGSGDVDSYQNFVRDNKIDNVIFSGRQSDIKGRLRNADIFVLPSRREGMSNALMEAMICGMPVVATDVSGSQDLIENNVSGLLIPVGDVNALASALIRMMNDPGKAIEMGKRGYEYIRSKCNMTIVAEKYKSLYNKISASA